VVVALTHAAGVSATGCPVIDAALPLPERYQIPVATAEAVNRARRERRRVIAVGTTVVRALESAFHHGRVVAGEGVATLRLGPGTPLQVVDALLTGMHQPGESHYQLLAAFVDAPLLKRAFARAVEGGYLAHEFGDATLVLCGAAERAAAQA
jgi:S-adenosylmethionine:tRNA ribosyltransferase-isomerase